MRASTSDNVIQGLSNNVSVMPIFWMSWTVVRHSLIISQPSGSKGLRHKSALMQDMPVVLREVEL
eukprot:207210-Pyramimonas_sp.AAC.1